MDVVQTQRTIKMLLTSAGLRPRKRFGQHFLIDGNLMRRLVESASLEREDLVLEVGSGTGGLTDLLVSRADQVLCVEIDRDLQAILADRLGSRPGVTLLTGDILESKHTIRPEVADRIRSYHGGASGSVKLLANLPYQIATPLVMNLLVDFPQVRRLCFTVQAEMGDRIVAKAGTRAYGPVSILAQTLGRISTVGRVGPQAFWPRPKVDSVMIRLDVKEPPWEDRDQVRSFADLVRSTFEHRRKTLRCALRYALNDSDRQRVCERVDATRRPESFTIEEWLEIYRYSRP